MALIVQKFGGTSVADIDRIRHVATLAQREIEAGHKIAVVVSAMAGATNQLVSWTEAVSTLYDPAEYDVVVSSGEQVTAGLTAMALQDLGLKARSFLNWQMPFVTDNSHSKARIQEIQTEKLMAFMNLGGVPVIPGFQGVSRENRITTLGRGGSDTSAVALAAALKADRCDIYTDVDGVYTTDPRIVPQAQKLSMVSFEEMLEMASLGAKVLQTRSVELAMKEKVRLQVRSSFTDRPGTMIVDEGEVVEQEIVTGIAYSRDDAKITLLQVPDKPGVAAKIFKPLSEANINVDMIVQNISEDGQFADMTFTVGKKDLARTRLMLEALQNELGYQKLLSDSAIAKISVVGLGMRSHAGVASKMFAALSEKGINIQVITTSEIKISVLIHEDYLELAVRCLHTAYGLDDEHGKS